MPLNFPEFLKLLKHILLALFSFMTIFMRRWKGYKTVGLPWSACVLTDKTVQLLLACRIFLGSTKQLGRDNTIIPYPVNFMPICLIYQHDASVFYI